MAMATASRRPEIDQHTMKLVAGMIAVALGPLTYFFAGGSLTSISASYWAGGTAQIIFLGFLFATASFFVAYNGESTREMIASKAAAVSALGVALFPCACDCREVAVPKVHGIAAAVMFLILTYSCYVFYRKARSKHTTRANVRAAIYAVCGLTMAASIVALAVDNLSKAPCPSTDSQLVFYGESAALLAFGISWLTASRMLPVVTDKNDRISWLN